MNTKDNKRKRESRDKIEKVFVDLLQTKDLAAVSVSEICKLACLNRSTFYANYIDIFELADQVKDKLEKNIETLYHEERTLRFNSNDYLRLFQHIKENQIFYRTYFALGYDNNYKIMHYDTSLAEKHFGNKHLEYHMEFFRAGITKIVKMWLEKGCPESAEEMNEIIMSEYRGRV